MHTFNMGQDINQQLERWMRTKLPADRLRRAEEVARDRERWAGYTRDADRLASSGTAAIPQTDPVAREALRLGFSSEVARRVSAELAKFGGDPGKAIASGWIRHSCLIIDREARKLRRTP